MTSDFSDEVVLRNTAAVLRSTVLPEVHDESVRLTVIQMIAVIEKHLVAKVQSPTSESAVARLDEQLSSDAGQLAAFRGRLVEAPDARA